MVLKIFDRANYRLIDKNGYKRADPTSDRRTGTKIAKMAQIPDHRRAGCSVSSLFTLISLLITLFINKSVANLMSNSSIENHIGHRITNDEMINPFSNQFNYDMNCHKPTQKPCEPLLVQTCFGVKLPYSMTSTELISPNMSQVLVQYKLKQWEGLKAMPKCWAAIQPLLCSMYMPKCQNGSVELPPQEICKITRSPCKAVEQTFLKNLPDLFRCDNITKFPVNCKTSGLRELRFNVSLGNCSDPLIEVAENSVNEYTGFEGCGLKCQDVFFDDEEHDQMSSLIFYMGIISISATGWVMLTYVIDWKSSRNSRAIFFANASYFIATVGWMLQFLPKGKQDTICRGDKTLRKQEYSPDETIACTFVFILIYWGAMCALNWLVVFAYIWNQTCHAVGRIREGLEKKSKNFHFSWALATILTVVGYVFGNVGGNSMTGICFIGYFGSVQRSTLLLLPVAVKVSLISFFMWKGIFRLWSLTSGRTTSDYIASKGDTEIRRQIIRSSIFAAVTLVATLLVFWFEINYMISKPRMDASLRQILICKLKLTEGEGIECDLPEKPGLIFHGSVFLFFAGGLLVSSLAWTAESVARWKRFFSRYTSSERQSASTNHKAHKHRLIAKAFSRRNDIANGKLSLSVGTSRDDPLGLNKLLDPNRVGKEIGKSDSQCLTEPPVNISSEWAANLPHLVARRGAIIPPHSSNSVSCVSDDSRRPSCDSVAMSELAAKTFQGGSQTDLEDKSRRSKRRWYDMGRRNRHGRVFTFNRKGNGGSNSSVSSAASNPPPQIFPAITALIDKKLGQNGQIGLTQVISQLEKTETREFAVQTSLENLNKPRVYQFGMMCDKETQSSIPSVHEIGVQTKKSATKKKEKTTKKEEKEMSKDDCQIIKLLSPN